jgi:hypothetical protein
VQAVDRDRPGDVLELRFAHGLEGDLELAAELLVDGAGDADAARLGELLDARGNVHPIAEHVAVLDDDVADIDAESEQDLAVRRHVGVAPGHALLDLDGAGRGIHQAGELDQHPVAGGLDDSAAVPGDRRVDELDPMRPEARQGAGLVKLHQPAVTHHVAGENRHQPALDTNLVHDIPVPGAGPRQLSLQPAFSPLMPDKCAFGIDASSAGGQGALHPFRPPKRRKHPAVVQFGCFCGFLLAFSGPISREVER